MEIHRAEGAIVQTVPRLPRLAPDHPSVIRADGAIETRLMERIEHGPGHRLVGAPGPHRRGAGDHLLVQLALAEVGADEPVAEDALRAGEVDAS